MSPIAIFSIALPILLQIAVVNVRVVLTMPAGQDMAPWLRITSNIEPERTYLGDVVGPFVTGNHLVITCSTDVSEAASLSWWEGEDQLPTVAESEDGTVSRSFVVGTLRAKDSQRHFTCRELVSGREKSVDLHLVDDHMEIQKNGDSLKDEGKVDVILGQDFVVTCVVNGTDPSTGTWWEGEAKLPAERTKRSNAIYNQLVMRPARIEDNGRKLTCRARNGQLTKSVVLNVVQGVPNLALEPHLRVPSTTGDRPTAQPPASANYIPLPPTASEVNIYIIIGGAIVAVMAVVVVILSFAIVMMGRKMIPQKNVEKRNVSAEQSEEFTSHDLPPVSPLLSLSLPVEGGDKMASSGGRMSVVRPDDRDHSYYYPDLINNSYYYPKMTDDVKVTLLA